MKRETHEERVRRSKAILSRLKKRYPGARTALRHTHPLELLIATILSAQCTDERVNKVTAVLFKKYRTALDYAQAPRESLENDIRSTGFFRAKAKNIANCCRMILGRFGGNVPSTMEELLELPGVGRKTANVVLGDAFGIAEGIVVDTHVRRLSWRMGFTRHTDPVKIERDLSALFPRKDWTVSAHLLIWHGRDTCRARTPRCAGCVLEDLCPSAGKFAYR